MGISLERGSPLDDFSHENHRFDRGLMPLIVRPELPIASHPASKPPGHRARDDLTRPSGYVINHDPL
jgi:hypothetical protein